MSLTRKSAIHQNQAAWNQRARAGECFARPATPGDLEDPVRRLDPRGWYEGIAGKHVLCLGAGGGKHGVLFAKAGARSVTVVDISEEMLALDSRMATEQLVDVETVHASIDDLSPLAGREFDLVAQPVSSCYVPDIRAVYQWVAQLTKPGALYVSQHKTPTNLQASLQPTAAGYVLEQPYYLENALPPAAPSRFRESGTKEFVHGWESLVGELCRNGFVLEDLVEVKRGRSDAAPGSFAHRCHYIAPYVRLKARRTDHLPSGTRRIVF